MDCQKQIKSLQQSLTSLLNLTKTISLNLKRESSRMSTVLNRYKTQKQTDGIFSHHDLRDLQLKDIQQYSQLLAKQFAVRLEELIKQHTAHKIQLEKLSHQCTSKPKENYESRMEPFKKIIKDYEDSLISIWADQHFLTLNYRLGISAKELERWTSVMESNRTNVEEVTKTVEGLFM